MHFSVTIWGWAATDEPNLACYHGFCGGIINVVVVASAAPNKRTPLMKRSCQCNLTLCTGRIFVAA